MKFDFAIYLLIALWETTFLGCRGIRDKRKNRYCEENNIRLIRIPYTDYNILNREYLISKIPEIQNEIKLSGNSDQA